jgi:ABC-type transport system involved in cytochrome c biogenesis permease subunit
MDRVTIFCFFASYTLALALEGLFLWRPRREIHALALVAGAAGLAAHTIYLCMQQPPLISQFSWMLFVAWVLAVYYVCGAVHHRRLAWGVFVLPLVLGLVGLAVLFGKPPGALRGLWQEQLLHTRDLWGPVHAVLILLATVGVCVGFLASLMYLFQAHRLRTKAPPGKGMRLLSLERLEATNRRAVVVAFPLLTAGMLAGVVLLVQGGPDVTWADPRVLSTLVLWVAFALLLCLRFGYHLRGRQVAFLTILTFLALLCCLVVSHSPRQGG